MTTFISKLTKINEDTQSYISKMNDITAKYLNEKTSLKGKIAELARAGAVEILSDENEETMGNPENLCKSLQNIQLEYNKIIQQEKKEINSLVCEYNSIIHKQLYPDCANLEYGPTGWWGLHKTKDDINTWVKKAAICEHSINNPSLHVSALWNQHHHPQYNREFYEPGGIYRKYIDQMGFDLKNNK